MINTKNALKLKRLAILLIILIIVSIAVPITYSKFQSMGTSNSDIKAAFYVLGTSYQSEDIKLDNIIPSNDIYNYTFSVSNNDGKDRCETDMEYTIKITTTTNLPLSYNLYKNNDSTSVIESEVIEADEYGTYFKKITSTTERFSHQQDETNTYKLTIVFPEEYNTVEYQNIVEGINLSIDSKQVIE